MATTKLLLLFLLTNIATTFSAAASGQQSTLLFIKKSCRSTSFPTLCYSSLSKYTSTIQQSPLQLAQVATKVSLSNVKSAAKKATSLYQQALASKTANSRTVKALKDCTDLLRDAADNTNYSISELKNMKGESGSEMLWSLANVQTYMSAALTKEDTCIDGLKEMGAVVKKVSGIVKKAEKYTSIALGLINSLRYS